jgi:hypothetical protein
MKTWFRYTVKKPLSYADFSEWQLPREEIKKALPCGVPLSEDEYAAPLVQARSILKAKTVVNSFAYSPMSGMYWHTNSDMVGTRLYYTFTMDKAVFKYVDPDTGIVHEDWDDIGWTAREFEITEDKPFWHSVWTSGRRFSFGFIR